MKFSEQWLRSLVNPALDSEQLAHLLTMAGLEVEEQAPAAPPFSRVVVAEVLSLQKHENADRLNVCQVNIGEAEPIQIVCGASNVAAGLKVPCALVGAELPGDFKIRQAKVRGVESFGMLCSAKELGLAEEADGLLVLPAEAPAGTLLRDYLQLDDVLLTLKLTPNRADCLSLQGLAREVSALTDTPSIVVDSTPVGVAHQAVLNVQLESPQACPRYTGRIIRGINFAAPTPDWMLRRLERSGLRSISAVVDVTNYVLLELGQPLHAFDLAKINGGVRVRFAAPGEALLLLNEKTIALSDDMLVIADDQGPLALAGIMGGNHSAVSASTQDIFLESAFFAPEVIAGKSRRLGFGSDSSYRFERGVDFSATQAALERASRLIIDICGGEAGPVVEALAELPARPAVQLRLARLQRVIGVPFAAEQVLLMLRSLGMQCQLDGDVMSVIPPAYRFDIEIEADLIEEVARLYGYENVPVRPPLARTEILPIPGKTRPSAALMQQMLVRDYQQVINYAFVDESWEANLLENTQPVRLQNPIASQMAVMRSSLMGGLLANLQHNLNRKQERVRIFEVGRVFHKTAEGYDQPEKLAALAFGALKPEQWGEVARRVDFFDVKADVEVLLANLPARFNRAEHSMLHPGRTAAIELNGRVIGVLGELHPRWVQQYALPAAPILFEIDLAAITSISLPQADNLSRFQSVRRDIAVLAPETLPVQAIMDSLNSEKASIISEIALFDLYRGKGVEEGMKSLAFRIVLQDMHKTLTDEEVEAAVLHLLAVLEQRHGAKLRI